MAEPLEIKHKQPTLRQMAADYRLMVSGGSNLKLMFFWLGVLSVLFVGWFVTPSLADPSANIVLRVLALLDAYLLFGFGELFALSLASPLLARFILPLIITLLEMVRLLVSVVQYLIDQVLIDPLIDSFLYPTRQTDATPDALRTPKSAFYDDAGNMIQTHEHKGDFKEP
jgi:hypothetical protein